MKRRSFFKIIAALVINPFRIKANPGLAFNKDAFAMTGISMKVVRNFDITSAKHISKLDALYGYGTYCGDANETEVHG